MQIHRGIENVRGLKSPIVTMGIFDGVHLGHKQILDVVLARAQEMQNDSLVITFDPHPRIVLHKDQENLKLITTIEERIERLRQCGVDNLLILPFTSELALLSSEDFIRNYIQHPLHPSRIIVGYDHQFGRHGEGNFNLLQSLGDEMGFEVEQVPAFELDGQVVSSSRIRESLLNGNVDKAMALLGYPYYIFGPVVEGNKVGRKIGYPTANIQPMEPHKLIPAMGVYAATAQLNGQVFKGMMNIGFRPTLNQHDLTIEIHLFDFDDDIYGKVIKLSMVERIRDEMRFLSIADLKNQLDEDKLIAQKILRDVVLP